MVILMLLVMFGTKLSGRVLATIVSVKLAAVILVIAVGARHVDTDNYTPFVPDVVSGAGARGSVLQSLLGGSGDAFGIMGIFTAAGVIVFAFIGFDLIATVAEDAREPRRSVPRAMLAAIGIVTALYVAMATVLVGLRPYKELGTDAPVSDALQAVGTGWAADVINIGALLALTTVVLVVLIAQSRVLFAMGRDGLLPPVLSRVGAESTPDRRGGRRRHRCRPARARSRAPPRVSSSSCSAPCSRSASARWASSRCAAPSRPSSVGSGCRWCRWSRACRCSRRCGCRSTSPPRPGATSPSGWPSAWCCTCSTVGGTARSSAATTPAWTTSRRPTPRRPYGGAHRAELSTQRRVAMSSEASGSMSISTAVKRSSVSHCSRIVSTWPSTIGGQWLEGTKSSSTAMPPGSSRSASTSMLSMTSRTSTNSSENGAYCSSVDQSPDDDVDVADVGEEPLHLLGE